MKTTQLNPHHTEVECRAGKVSVNTADGIQLTVDSFGDEVFIDLRREEAEALVELLKEALR